MTKPVTAKKQKNNNTNFLKHSKDDACQLDKLPDELLTQIFSNAASTAYQLRTLEQVCKRFRRLAQNQKLWYLAFRANYPTWSRNTVYSKGLIDWKGYVLHLENQHRSTKQFSFKFINEEPVQQRKETDSNSNRRGKRKYGQFVEDNEGQELMEAEQDTATARRRVRRPTRTLRPMLRTTAADEREMRGELLESFMRPIPLQYSSPPFVIQDPLVVDIDRVTQTGVVATGKHRRQSHLSEHSILFWAYPSWKLIRKFELTLAPGNLSCQIIGIQSVKLPNKKKVRLFSIAVGKPFQDNGEGRVDIWNALFIYQLNDQDGSTECLSHIKITDRFLGREVFLFSEASWGQSNDGDTDETSGGNTAASNCNSKVKDWLQIISPEHADYDPNYTVFVAAMGPILNDIRGCVQLAKFDIRASYMEDVLDPSEIACIWDEDKRELVPMTAINMLRVYHYISTRLGLLGLPNNDTNGTSDSNASSGLISHSDRPTSFVKRILLGEQVSCMIHFKYPPQLNHLICTGSFVEDELSVYDWRFGLKVGTLPWKTVHTATTSSSNATTPNMSLDLHPTTPTVSDNQNLRIVDDSEIMAREVLRDNEPIIPEARQSLAEDLRLVVQEAEEAEIDEGDVAMIEVEEEERELEEEEEEEEGGGGGIVDNELDDASPWGLESTFAIPCHWSSASNPSTDTTTLADHGLRLIAVGDTRSDVSRLEIKIWDISYLLNINWDPLKDDEADHRKTQLSQKGATDKRGAKDDDLKGLPAHIKRGVLARFSWWPRRTKELARLAIRMVRSDTIRREAWKKRGAMIEELNRIFESETMEISRQREEARRLGQPFERPRIVRGTPPSLSFFEKCLLEQEDYDYRHTKLPYSTDDENQPLLLCHTFDKNEQSLRDRQQSIPPHQRSVNDHAAKYTAYNVLYTSLFLLTEDGKVTVMDIETGRVTGTVNNVAEDASDPDCQTKTIKHIHGIDVNVIGGKEVVVTSKEGILRGLV